MNETIRPAFVSQIGWCTNLGSPLYAEMLSIALEDLDRDGPVAKVVGDFVGDASPHVEGLPLRFMGGVHRLVLRGQAPDLGAHFPTVGGTPDGQSLPEDFLTAVDANVEMLREALSVPPQTNEIGRSAALFPGLVVALAGEDRPIRLLEIGSSAGLNMLLDLFGYSTDSWSWAGVDGAPVLSPLWTGSPPEVPDSLNIVSRRGCDASPIDVLDPLARERLVSFVWADQLERFQRLNQAIDLVTPDSFDLDRADAGEWLVERLDEPVADGTLTVVQHSVMWQYLPESTQDDIMSCLARAGAAATSSTPLAHVAYESVMDGESSRGMGLTVTRWPGAGGGLVAYGQAHGAAIVWQPTG